MAIPQILWLVSSLKEAQKPKADQPQASPEDEEAAADIAYATNNVMTIYGMPTRLSVARVNLASPCRPYNNRHRSSQTSNLEEHTACLLSDGCPAISESCRPLLAGRCVTAAATTHHYCRATFCHAPRMRLVLSHLHSSAPSQFVQWKTRSPACYLAGWMAALTA